MINKLKKYQALEKVSREIYLMSEKIESCVLNSNSLEIGVGKIEAWDFELNVEDTYEGQLSFIKEKEGFIEVKITNEEYVRKLAISITGDFSKIFIDEEEYNIYVSSMPGYVCGYNIILCDEIQYQKTLAYFYLLTGAKMGMSLDNTQMQHFEKYMVTENLKTNNYEKLNELVGLETIKTDVKSLVNLMKIQIKRKEQGLKMVPVSLHLVFSGNPGTGKTTIARIIAGIYKDIGILSKGQLIEVDRAGLVAGYVGQTAIKTQEKIDEALGGVLFIDEAYTLVKNENDYGQEAIDTILKAMEDHRDDFVVIVAGYSELMQNFINSNPGLKSRFNKYIHFPDYKAEELINIFMNMCDKYDFILSEDAIEVMKQKIYNMEKNKDANFANARDVRNLFERVITQQATRLSEIQTEDIMRIEAEDFK